ncbi:MAG: hypothetical protein ACK5JF_07390 [Oscillospiraceae bacterium]
MSDSSTNVSLFSSSESLSHFSSSINSTSLPSTSIRQYDFFLAELIQLEIGETKQIELIFEGYDSLPPVTYDVASADIVEISEDGLATGVQGGVVPIYITVGEGENLVSKTFEVFVYP